MRLSQAQLQALHLVLVGQAAGQVLQRLDEAEAVDLQPQLRVDLAGNHARVELGLDAAGSRRHQVGAQHVFQRPARLDAAQALFGGLVEAPRHRTDLVADDGMEALARGGVELGLVQQFDRGLQVAQGAAMAFGDAVQQAVAFVVIGQVAGDVVEHQHEAVQRLSGRCFGRAHRRHLHTQQLPTGRGRHELRRRMRSAALQALLHRLQRVQHQAAVEHTVDAAAQAQPQRFGAADGLVGRRAALFAGRQGAELQTRPGIEEQHAAVQVAHHHALRQLGHQRGQPVAFLFDLAAGLGHTRGHVGAQCVALLHQGVDGAGQCAAAGAAGTDLQFALNVSGQQHLQILGQPAGGGAKAQPGAAAGHAGCDGRHQPDHEDQRDTRLQQRPQRTAFGRRERRRQHAGHPGQHQRQQGAGQQCGPEFCAIDLHHLAPVITKPAFRAPVPPGPWC